MIELIQKYWELKSHRLEPIKIFAYVFVNFIDCSHHIKPNKRILLRNKEPVALKRFTGIGESIIKSCQILVIINI